MLEGRLIFLLPTMFSTCIVIIVHIIPDGIIRQIMLPLKKNTLNTMLESGHRLKKKSLIAWSYVIFLRSRGKNLDFLI